MKNLQKTFPFMFVLLLTLGGCIGQKGEKKADCAANQTFDQRSRQCIGAQKPPQPLLDDITIFEDQGAQTITLNYTDPNGSEANNCKINFTDTNVWMRAPEWDTAASRADQTYSYGYIAANAINPISFPVQRGDAFAQEAIARAAKLNAAAARTNSQMYQSIRVVANAVRQIGNIALGVPDSIVQARGADALAEAAKMDVLANLIENMCSCVGGICKTVAVPDKNWYGSVGFTYSISDSFGTGPVEQVTLTVQSMNDAPHPQPQNVNDNEPTNSSPASIIFTVNPARDVEDDIFSNFFTYTVTNGSNAGSYIQLPKGRLYDCMGINGSAPTDRTCLYIPTDGDLFGVGQQAAAYNFNGIDWFAKSTGVWGNDIKVTFVEHPVTRMGGLNGADGEKTVDITVVGKEITIMVESHAETVGVDVYDAHTAQNVVDAINADPYASALLTVNPVSPASPVTTGTVTLASGTDGHDKIEYTVNDGISNSTWSGVVSINIFAMDDEPQPTTFNLALNEDAASTLTLNFFDAEGDTANVAPNCDIASLNANIQARGDCVCAGTSCSFPVQLMPNANGTATFDYRVHAGANSPGPYTNPDVTVTINAVNDPPYPVSSQVAANESATAAPAYVTFSISPAYEVEGDTNLTYKITALPTQGTISNCAAHTVGATINTSNTCYYMPGNGNSNGIGVAGRTANINDIFYTSRFAGAHSNKIKIRMDQTYGVAAGSPVILFDQEVVTGELHVQILIDQAGTTNSLQVATAINSHPYLGQIIYADIAPLGTTDTNTTTAQSTFAQVALDSGVAGVDPMDFLEYEVVDSSGAGNNTSLFKGRHHIVMTATDDTPAICDYSKFNEANECGLNGCIDSTTPVGNITPSKEGLLFYHLDTGVCYRSKNLDNSGALTSNDWIIAGGYAKTIGDITFYRETTTGTVNINNTLLPSSPPTCSVAGSDYTIDMASTGATATAIVDAIATTPACAADLSAIVTGVGTATQGTTSSAQTLEVVPAINDRTVNEMEKVVIDGVRVDEGGGDATEDGDAMEIANGASDITSSNPILVPVDKNNIKFYYAGNLIDPVGAWNYGDTTALPLGDGGASADLDEFKIVVTPAINQTGSSTISFKISDGVKTRQVSFKVTVNPVAIQHNGWKNISAVGPGIDANDLVTDMSKVCNYSRTKCSGGNCKGSNDPVNVVTPDKKYAIYYNTLSKQCFYANGTTSADWVVLDSYCNISPVEYLPACDPTTTTDSEGSCIGTNDPTSTGLNITPTKENQFFYDVTSNTCYRSRNLDGAGSLDSDDWDIYKATGQVTLEWEDFTVVGAGVLSGFNVYRRIAGEEFDYDMPINKTLISPSVRKYFDNADNSWYAPVPKTVYYYDVRPIVNGLPTGEGPGSSSFNIVRLIVPEENKAFVHRWMVNKSVCKMMNSTTIDPQNNFRCLYLGPGSTDTNAVGAGGLDVYDIGSDLIVDRFEAGCNFDRSPACDTQTGDCVSNTSPSGVVTANTGTIFYDRSTGTCYRNTNNATGWTAVTDDAASRANNEHTIAQNPPLVNVTQTQAFNYCANGGATTHNIGTLGYTGGTARALPNRKQQIAYSLWDDILNTDTQITILETGLSINSSSKCNSSNASGLDSGYTDSAVTNSNNKYSLPGTTSSNIRSIITGSSETRLCASRFGVQDHVGNVAEFTVDRIDCHISANDGLSTCDSINGADGALSLTYTQATDNVATPAWDRFRINSEIGPCRDTDSDGECDAYIDKWILDEERYSAGRFFVPMGLPVHVNYNSTNSGDSIISYLYNSVNYNFLSEIGPSSGILADKLHDDVFAPNTHHLFATRTNVGHGVMTAGGSYLSGSGAGVWTAEFIPLDNNALGFVTVGDVSFKRVHTTMSDIKVAIQTGGAGATTCTLDDPDGDGTNNRVLISLSTTAGSNEAQDVRAAVNSAPCNTLVQAAVSGGDVTTAQVTTTADVSMFNFTPANNAPNVGFRCIYPVSDGSYQP